MRKGVGREVNRTELSEVFGCALTTIDGWVRSGCPVISRGSKGVAWAFNTADVAAWRESRARTEAAGVADAGVDELRLRKLAAETQIVELELAKASGEVAPVEAFERTMISVFAKVRAKMRMLPPRVALLLVGQADESAIRAILAREVDDALRDLGTSDLRDDEAE